ncbi:hypothetical protein [Rhizobium leguminosarum]|uniref:hypothetical protein n=1 Tax=Rhizobium leguminosarum TaxID=384 RepID=UPI001C95837B|nr:hypothetical protein [Rhizobium leguminosarum]MBY5462045.1 hypothetical protein [Rhizobium leguminosarum]
MLTAVLAWLTSSVGKVVAKWGALGAAIGLAYWRIRESGRAAERADRAKDTLAAAAERERTHDDVSRMPDDRVRDELRQWVRRDG